MRTLDVDGMQLVSHSDKTVALTAYYTNILGGEVRPTWDFDINLFYADAPCADPDPLVAPFTAEEARRAVRSMAPDSAPGPDGVGPNFYSAAWATVSATTSSAFRPVSLQNCPVKILTKVLTTRLQRQIGRLIDADQTGFIKGRSISENFVRATELVHTCHRRRAPTLVLKLDFAKAFDSICWEGKHAPDPRSPWVPGTVARVDALPPGHVQVGGARQRRSRTLDWITCKRGLRQGDALSPYLFILVADVLQQLVRAEPGLKHPLADDSAPVLQYADDTIVLLRVDDESVRRLKATLERFTTCTGLVINFNKSTVTPMHVAAADLQRFLDIMQCQEGRFPQTYLGLPLSNTKLPLSAFAPLIARVDRYLSTWKALLLSTAGRVVLVNAVLDGLQTYAMGAMVLPPSVLKQLDARRRAFLWTGTDTASGAQCLVAWEDVCRDKEDGGLGVARLDTRNACQLLKLLHRLHHSGNSAWATWAASQIDLATLAGDLQGPHWEAIRALLPAYQQITRVEAHGLLGGPLARRRPPEGALPGLAQPLRQLPSLSARRRGRWRMQPSQEQAHRPSTVRAGSPRRPPGRHHARA